MTCVVSVPVFSPFRANCNFGDGDLDWGKTKQGREGLKLLAKQLLFLSSKAALLPQALPLVWPFNSKSIGDRKHSHNYDDDDDDYILLQMHKVAFKVEF